MADEERRGQDFLEEADDALAESRREAAEEGRTIEDQPGSLDAPGEDGEDEVTAF